MTIGNPLLAAWDATGVLRTFEYASGSFVQTGSVGGLTHTFDDTTVAAMEFPFLYWINSDSQCLLVRSPSLAELDLALISTTAVIIDTEVLETASPYAPFRAVGCNHSTIFVNKNVPGASNASRQYAAPDGVNISGTGANFILASRKKWMAFSPDASLYMHKTLSGSFDTGRRTGLVTDFPFTFTGASSPSPGISADLAAWAYDNKTIVFVDVTLNRAQSWSRDPSSGSWSMIQEISPASGTPVSIAMSPDKRKMAIGSVSSGVYSTRIFRRTGSYFIFEQDLASIGQLIDFTEDGKILIDCRSRTAYRKNSSDLFDLDNSIMVNIPTGIRSQALSQGLSDPYGNSFFYDGAIARFASKTADLDNLKITLLTDAASFSSSDTSFNEVTSDGSLELQDGGWPIGGLLLTGVAAASNESSYSLICDQLQRIIIESGISFRYGLIYDATTSEPLIFLDFVTQRSVPRNRRLLIDFSDSKLLSFSN